MRAICQLASLVALQFGLLTGLSYADPESRTGGDAPSFDHDVMPVLSRVGCNLGTCHGNLNGKGDLRLSLRGQDPWQDYLALTQELGARRLNRQEPASSLMLLKPTAAVPHQGGQRLVVGSHEYQILADWIRAGAPGPDPDAARVRQLLIEPSGLVVRRGDQAIPLTVVAVFDDGQQRDVTSLCSYEASNYVASITPDGQIRRLKPGESSIAVRYLDQQRSIRVAFVPETADRAAGDERAMPEAARHWIDQAIVAKQQALGLPRGEIASDAVFVRRAFLDTLGQLPTADESRAFGEDPDAEKRVKLIDQLLARPEFADHWAMKWSDLLRNEEKLLDATGVERFHDWIRDAIAQNIGIDRFVAELVTGKGSTYENPPANFYRALRDPLERGEAAARLFLGVRLQCAKCHNHPFDHWTQDDYYDWAAVFARIDYEIVENNRKDKFDQQEFVGEQRVVENAELHVTNPRTGQHASPRFLVAETRRLDPQRDRLQQLADWLTGPDNRAFAQAQANRIWYHLFGRGLVEPLDDFRVTNPASHPELLDRLAEELVASHFDLKHLVRQIMLSRTYQAAPLEDDQNLLAAENYGGIAPRRLTAEQLLDAQCQVLGVNAQFNGYQTGTHAVALAGVQRIRPREKSPSDDDRFLTLFGKPPRLMNCECERSDDTTLAQAFNLMNGPGLQQRLRTPENRLGQWLDRGLPGRQVVDELFWTALGRAPSAVELEAATEYLERSDDRRAALEDLAWAILNAKEFLFRR